MPGIISRFGRKTVDQMPESRLRKMLKKYEIKANLLCHDVRLNTEISIVVEMANEPDEAEAGMLLAPVAEELLSAPAYDCGGCRYELSNFRITLPGA